MADLDTGQALLLCKSKGYPITKAGITQAGVREGFAYKPSMDTHWRFKRAALEEYLVKATALPPDGWITVNHASIDQEVRKEVLYDLIKARKIAVQFIGPGYGVMYIDPQELKRVVESGRTDGPGTVGGGQSDEGK